MSGDEHRRGLRVGLTGGLGSGKSTVASMFAALGVHTISADEIGRELMSPGQPVHADIVSHFGTGVLRAGGTLDRKALALLAFNDGRVEELNRIVHPAVIAAQEGWATRIFAQDPGAIAMVESALIFEVERGEVTRGEVERHAKHRSSDLAVNAESRQRFDKIILVTVPEEQKIARYMTRVSPGRWDESIATDARNRLAAQIPDKEKILRSDYVIQNTGTLEETAAQVGAILSVLQEFAGRAHRCGSDPPEHQESR